LRVPLEEDRFAFDFGVALDFDFALDFVAVFAIADSATPCAFP
jgi:hypothetical protein